MKKLKNKKVIGIMIFLFIAVSVSLLTYGKNRNNVFKDEYMQNIFIDEDSISTEEENMNTDYLQNFREENNNLTIENKVADTNLETVSNNTIVVEIKGEVMNPDVYTLNEGSIIKDLIEAAGGLTQEADISNINRAKEIKNHELIIIRNINDLNIEEEYATEDKEINEESDDGKISINDSDLSKLKEIPGIGEVKANSIISYREKNNGFKSIEELKNVDGIGEKTFEKIKDSIKL
ncbi:MULTISPECIES: helix-hairpin-helix domain-containing protein [unclassified Clostridium]|uniref:helix-hairpin-helix domain-containing protein n=1 Tax=unclassified Clostridium TaxID=2614128 RepID=UPI001896D851|nr:MULTISPECIES: helix-hairpin-helix domain-containing protein [unclassified Clostridium]MBO5130878.1 helix-hairpin-helix domain-containing protein [Romboutsia sp.]MBP3915496.1 helix-hairpin-helix domain-containing protein [Clostridium sp.]MEE0933094.1 helix-hairpin-helix domain-containing protein [Clostridium sp.]